MRSAAATATLVLHFTNNWRAVFFVGVLPALLTLWVRRHVPESAMFAARKSDAPVPFRTILRGPLLRPTLRSAGDEHLRAVRLVGPVLVAAALPGAAPRQGGTRAHGLGLHAVSHRAQSRRHVAGYFSYGFIADRLGRRRTFALYFFTAAVLV
jgi:MFS family permease